LFRSRAQIVYAVVVQERLARLDFFQHQ
jgi:hypothetical protein